MYAKYHWDLCNNEGSRSRATTNILEHILDPPTTAAAEAALTYQTHIGPTLHVEPKYACKRTKSHSDCFC